MENPPPDVGFSKFTLVQTEGFKIKTLNLRRKQTIEKPDIRKCRYEKWQTVFTVK